MARRPILEDEDETPPWMERAPKPARALPEPEPTHTLISWRALIIGAAIALVAAIGLVIGVRRMSTPDAATVAAANGEVPLIRAPAAPYKTRLGPDTATATAAVPGGDAAGSADPIGTLASGDDMVSPPPAQPAPARAPTDLLRGTAAANGPVDATADAPTPAELAAPPAEPARVTPNPPSVAIKARPANRAAPEAIDTSVVQDEPVLAPKPKAKTKHAPSAATASAPETFKLPAADVAEAIAHGGGPGVQIGAFSTQAKAEAAWAAATAAHGELAGLHRQIETIVRDGRTLYRLRATGTGSLTPERCAAFKAMGAVCVK